MGSVAYSSCPITTYLGERVTKGDSSVIGIIRPLVALVLLAVLAAAWPAAAPAADVVPAEKLFRRDNLVAWCIVPFDDEARSPADRAAMMKRLAVMLFPVRSEGRYWLQAAMTR
jgi:hypothetical protein